MNEADRKERMSAFMDGEVRGSEVDRAVEELYRSPEGRSTWSRYHLIGDVLRQTGPVPGANTIADRVSAELANEGVVHAESRFRSPVWTPLRGLALAASVAAVAMLGIGVLDDGSDQMTTPSIESAGLTPELTPPATGSRAQRLASASAQRIASGVAYWPQNETLPDTEARLNAYLVNHSEHGGHGLQGVLPYVRVVGYQTGSGGRD